MKRRGFLRRCATVLVAPTAIASAAAALPSTVVFPTGIRICAGQRLKRTYYDEVGRSKGLMEFVRDAHVWKHHPSFDGMSEDLREAFATPPSPGMIITTEENYKRLKDYT